MVALWNVAVWIRSPDRPLCGSERGCVDPQPSSAAVWIRMWVCGSAAKLSRSSGSTGSSSAAQAAEAAAQAAEAAAQAAATAAQAAPTAAQGADGMRPSGRSAFRHASNGIRASTAAPHLEQLHT
eukprot:364487-Chlamydomonas_euryale.AAC.37